MEIARRVLACTVVILVVSCTVGNAQTGSSKPDPPGRAVYVPRDKTLEVWGGMGLPLTHTSFTDFWKRGPAMGFGLMLRVTDNLKIGVGIEASLYSFRRGTFLERYPGAPLPAQDQTLVHLYLSIRNYFQARSRFSPYLGGDIGFARISGAENKEVINAVRVTYYDIPGTTRLTIGGVAGADYYLARGFALQADVRGIYLHNDPNVGLVLLFRGGVKFKL